MGVDRAIDITAGQRKTILALLEQYLPGTTVWAYGSRAKWTARPQSDLDMVVFATPEQNGRVGELREAFEESNLPFRVDLFVWDAVPESFYKQIEVEHVVLAAREEHLPQTSRRLGMGSEWFIAEFSDAIDFQEGPGILAKDFRDSGVPLVRLAGLDRSSLLLSHCNFLDPEMVAKKWSHFGLTEGDILLSTSASLGRIAVVGQEGIGAIAYTGIIRMRPRDKRLIAPFIRYLLEGPDFQQQAEAFGSGSVIRHFGPMHLRQMSVCLPPLEEQRAIAHILGTLDDKIDLNRRMNETLEAMARALFKDWFVDFGPTRARMEGRDLYLPPEIWALFPDKLDDDGKPEGWEVSEIGKEIEAVGGATPSTKEVSYWERGEHHWVTPRDLSKLVSPVLLYTDRKITEAGVKRIRSGLLPTGTVLLSSRAPIGYLAITEVPTAVNQGFIAMICKRRLPNVFVLFWCYENLDYIKRISGGSTFAEISKKAFRPIPVVVPSEQLLLTYEGLVRPLYERIVVNTIETVSLAQIRDLLLPKLMSGEIRVADAEKTAHGAA